MARATILLWISIVVCLVGPTVTQNCSPACESTGQCVPGGECVCQGNYFGNTCGNDCISANCAAQSQQCQGPNNCRDCSPACDSGWTCVTKGNQPTCVIDDCTVCLNGGSCTESDYPEQCEGCDHGYTGTLCDEVDCTTCQNGGNCTQGASECEGCDPGYQGIWCEQVDCTTCQNGGNCTQGASQCEGCDLGYQGIWCEQVNCSLCLNGGSCGEGSGATQCASCDQGYIGDFCEQVDCSACDNGGSCTSPAFICDNCNPGFGGPLCRDEESTAASTSLSSLLLVVAISAAAFK